MIETLKNLYQRFHQDLHLSLTICNDVRVAS